MEQTTGQQLDNFVGVEITEQELKTAVNLFAADPQLGRDFYILATAWYSYCLSQRNGAEVIGNGAITRFAFGLGYLYGKYELERVWTRK